MIWGALAFSAVSIVLALAFSSRQSALSRRVGKLEAEAEALRNAIRWFQRHSSVTSRAPLSGPESVDRINRLPDNKPTG